MLSGGSPFPERTGTGDRSSDFPSKPAHAEAEAPQEEEFEWE